MCLRIAVFSVPWTPLSKGNVIEASVSYNRDDTGCACHFLSSTFVHKGIIACLAALQGPDLGQECVVLTNCDLVF